MRLVDSSMERGKPRILTVGSFDTPHLGHYSLMRQIKDLFPFSYLMVGVNRDDFIKQFKGKKPVLSYKERVKIISQIELVDEVFPNEGGADSKILIKKVNPNVIAIGSDWLRKDYLKQMGFTAEWLESKAIALIYIPRFLNVSTTLIKSMIRQK